MELTILQTSNILVPALIGGGTALLLGAVILLVFRFFSFKEDPLIEEINEVLPGINCGGCGYSGCLGYATALASGKDTNTSKCTAGGVDTAEAVAITLGTSPQDYIPQVAHVFCQGSGEYTSKRYDYTGTTHCASATGLFGGPNSCTYGCLGFGDCYDVCEFDAIWIADGLAHVNHNNCTACGKCVTACPKDLISLIPKHELATVNSCSNHWPAAATRRNCKIGCISCRRCVKVCPVDAISIDDNLAVIDQEICIHCGECIKVCPTHSITEGLLGSRLTETAKKAADKEAEAADTAEEKKNKAS